MLISGMSVDRVDKSASCLSDMAKIACKAGYWENGVAPLRDCFRIVVSNVVLYEFFNSSIFVALFHGAGRAWGI